MHIKIFADEKPIYISAELTDALKELSEKETVLFYTGQKQTDAPALLDAMKVENITAAIITGKDITVIKENLFSQFAIIEAAGGIVQNAEKDILFIFRRGKWDLPKGKMEPGESAETCAAREIEEETGVKNLSLKRKIGETYHIYNEKRKGIVKISHWYYFTCSGPQKTAPQTEEDITEVKWIPTQKIKEPMSNTYGNIRDIMSEFFDKP